MRPDYWPGAGVPQAHPWPLWRPPISFRHVGRARSRGTQRAHPVQSRQGAWPATAGTPRLRLPHSRPGPHAGRWRLLILLLAYTGLRWGEATALRVCDIDFERRRIDVRRAFSDVGGRVVLGTSKSHQFRTVPVPRFVAAELAAVVDGKRPDDLVFTMPGGSVMRLSNWRHATFVPARTRAGLSDRFRIHDLRHTAA